MRGAEGEAVVGQADQPAGGLRAEGRLVVTATNLASVSVRRALAARPGGVINVTFLSLPRLAERLGAAALAEQGRRPLTPPVLGAAIRAVLHEQPGIFATVADHPATEVALVAALRDLAACTAESLDSLERTGERAADVVRIAREVRIRLAPDWYDEHDLYRAASNGVRAGCPLDGPVHLHLVERMTPAAIELVAALAERVDVTATPPLTGDPELDDPIIAGHGAAGILFDTPHDDRQQTASRAISASDPDEEVRAVVRTVVGWAEQGVPLARMAVLFTARDPYLRMLHEQLAAAGVRHNGAPLRPVGELLYGRTIRRLMALPDHDMRRRDVMGLLAGSRFRNDGGLLPTRSWERITRAAAVVAGADWDGRLARYIGRLRGEADEYDADGQQAIADGRRRDADRADALLRFVGRLQEQLADLMAATTWSALTRHLRTTLDEHLGGERHRVRWPDAERDAADRIDGILDRLASLDAIAGPPPTLAVYRRTLEGELESALLRDGHLGDGVFVGPLSAAVGLDADKVVVIGMAEGTFPTRRLDDSLLPDRDRVVTGGQLPTRSDRALDDRRHLLLALAGAGESVLTFARGDLRRQGERHPSRWLLDATPPGVDATKWIEAVPSFVAGLTNATSHASPQEVRLARILARGLDAVAAEDATVGRNAALARSRRSPDFTRFDGNLAGVGVPDPTAGGSTTATRLEAWVACPHAYFQRYLLGVAPIEEPGARLEIDPLTRGTLLHEVLETFVKGRIDLGEAAPWDAGQAELLVDIGAATWDRYAAQGLTGHAVFSDRDRTRALADLRRVAAEDDGMPLAVEWAFDDVPYPLPDGRVIRFRGKVDRIDDIGGTHRVTDYKTGKADRYGSLSEAAPDGKGTHLQLAIYAAAVAHARSTPAVHSRYWFPTARGEFKAVGYRLTPEVGHAVSETLEVIADGIAAGAFPHRPPGTPSFGYVDCWWCTPDGLGAAEMRRSWERKRHAPVLERYLALVGEDAGAD